MDDKSDLVIELLITNTALTTRLVRSVSALLEVMRETVPDFEKRYLATRIPPHEEPELSKLLEEVVEIAQKLSQASRHSDKA